MSNNSLLAPQEKGMCFIVSAPAGTGKTTLIQMLVKEFPNIIASVSYTTRPPRDGEVNGKHYHFISDSQFEEKIAATDFLEYVKLYGYYYGTSKQWIEEKRQQGKHVVLVIDTQGALSLKGRLDATFIFISPPSLQELKSRLTKRQTESQEMVEKRLVWAKQEMEASTSYDYLVVNDDLSVAYQVLRSIFIAESHRTSHQNVSFI